MYVCAPSHISIAVRTFLNDIYLKCWVGEGRPITWTARSPDLNPLDFYLWCHLKVTMCAVAVNDGAELQWRVEDGCKLIHKTSGIEHV
jgi:hypothetical protein